MMESLCACVFDTSNSVALPLVRNVLRSPTPRTLDTVLVELRMTHPAFRKAILKITDAFPVVRIRSRTVYHPYMKPPPSETELPSSSVWTSEEWIVGTDLRRQVPPLLEKAKRILAAMSEERDALVLESTFSAPWKCPSCKSKRTVLLSEKTKVLCEACGGTMVRKTRSVEGKVRDLQEECLRLEDLLRKGASLGTLPDRQRTDDLFDPKEQKRLRKQYEAEAAFRKKRKEASPKEKKQLAKQAAIQKQKDFQDARSRQKWECGACNIVRSEFSVGEFPLEGDPKCRECKKPMVLFDWNKTQIEFTQDP